MHAHASPTLSTPVATGTPALTMARIRFTVPPAASTPVTGSPPAMRWACSGHSLTSLVQCRSSRSRRSARSWEWMETVTDQVPESPGVVRIE